MHQLPFAMRNEFTERTNELKHIPPLMIPNQERKRLIQQKENSFPAGASSHIICMRLLMLCDHVNPMFLLMEKLFHCILTILLPIIERRE
jgi:hypothetical protein